MHTLSPHQHLSSTQALLGIALQPDAEVVTYIADQQTPRSACADFIRSLPYILARRPGAHVVVIGCPETGNAVDRRRVHFLENVATHEVDAILQRTRVHVCLGDPFEAPQSMLGAMAAGCIVVSTKSVATRELIQDGFNGFLVPNLAPRAIAMRVVEVLQHYAELQFMCDNARGTAEEPADVVVNLARFGKDFCSPLIVAPH